MKPNLDFALRNLVRHDIRHHGNRHNLFCDAFAQFGVAFPAMTPLGIGPVCPRGTLSTYQIAHPALQLWLGTEEVPASLQRQDLECLPWITKERSQLPVGDGMLAVDAEHVFLDDRSLVSEFRFTNDSETAFECSPAWQGRIADKQESYMLPYFHGATTVPRTPVLRACEGGIFGGLIASVPENDIAQVAMRITTCDQRVSARINGELTYDFRPITRLSLAPGESVVFQFRLDIAFLTLENPDLVWPETSLAEFSQLTEVARTRFTNAIASEEPPVTAHPALTLRAWRARYALLRNGLRGGDGEFGDRIACLCTPDNTDFSCVFFWDTLFSSVAIKDFHPDYAKGAIFTPFTRQDPRDGSAPERHFNHGPTARMAQQSPMAPIASWAVREYLGKHDDPVFLAEIYPTLTRNHSFWRDFSDVDRDGLAELRWSGQIADNSPLWDLYAAYDATTGCGWVPPVASVPINCFLYWDANHLAKLAEQLGRDGDAEAHRARMAQIQRDLFAVCYVPEERRFWDYNHHTRQHRRVKTFYLFWPLFAGMDVPEETTRDLIENVLLDPKQFFGKIPFPSVAYDEPTYDPVGYWRGRAWPHITYWLLQTLVRHGYVDEAKEAARRVLKSYGNSAGFPENIATDPARFDASGFADYNWGNAAFYLIATEQYLRPGLDE